MTEQTKLGIVVIGIDCATDESKTGLSLAQWRPDHLDLCKVNLCGKERPAASIIIDWLEETERPALLAIDAPLGWPIALAQTLASHRAGDEIKTTPNEMFRRTTDRFIQKTMGKIPLEVGADRIARTAHAALRLLTGVGAGIEGTVPLAWSPRELMEVSAIEVYPAATLVVHGLRSTGYKKKENLDVRREIVEGLKPSIPGVLDFPLLIENADALDAVVCLLAAKDFLEGRAIPPSDRDLAEKEGWIWVAPVKEKVKSSS